MERLEVHPEYLSRSQETTLKRVEQALQISGKKQVLIYGLPGTGKTTLLASLVRKNRDIKYGDWSPSSKSKTEKLVSFTGFTPPEGIDNENFIVIKHQGFTASEMLGFLTTSQEEALNILKISKLGIATLCLGSLSSLKQIAANTYANNYSGEIIANTLSNLWRPYLFPEVETNLKGSLRENISEKIRSYQNGLYHLITKNKLLTYEFSKILSMLCHTSTDSRYLLDVASEFLGKSSRGEVKLGNVPLIMLSKNGIDVLQQYSTWYFKQPRTMVEPRIRLFARFGKDLKKTIETYAPNVMNEGCNGYYRKTAITVGVLGETHNMSLGAFYNTSDRSNFDILNSYIESFFTLGYSQSEKKGLKKFLITSQKNKQILLAVSAGDHTSIPPFSVGAIAATMNLCEHLKLDFYVDFDYTHKGPQYEFNSQSGNYKMV